MDDIINDKISFIKKEVRALQEIFSNLYQEEQKFNNNQLVTIRRNIEKFKIASKYLSNLKFEKRSDSEKLEEEIISSYESICKKTNDLNQKLDLLYNKESIRSASSYINSLKYNLDVLRLGFNYLKRIDFYGLLKKDEKKNKFEKKGD